MRGESSAGVAAAEQGTEGGQVGGGGGEGARPGPDVAQRRRPDRAGGHAPPASGGGTPAAARSSGSRSADQPRSASCSSQRPITLRRKRTVPSTPSSLVKLARRLSSVSTGSGSSRPTSDQVPHEM